MAYWWLFGPLYGQFISALQTPDKVMSVKCVVKCGVNHVRVKCAYVEKRIFRSTDRSRNITNIRAKSFVFEARLFYELLSVWIAVKRCAMIKDCRDASILRAQICITNLVERIVATTVQRWQRGELLSQNVQTLLCLQYIESAEGRQRRPKK